MDVLARGAQGARSFSGAKVSGAIRKLDYQGLGGRISYDDKGDLLEQRIYVFEVKQGEFVQVAP
jgi:ABC-type branched-subunit amino acid transport system substrate-binding protein